MGFCSGKDFVLRKPHWKSDAVGHERRVRN